VSARYLSADQGSAELAKIAMFLGIHHARRADLGIIRHYNLGNPASKFGHDGYQSREAPRGRCVSAIYLSAEHARGRGAPKFGDLEDA
jgi:hypothetical protein